MSSSGLACPKSRPRVVLSPRLASSRSRLTIFTECACRRGKTYPACVIVRIRAGGPVGSPDLALGRGTVSNSSPGHTLDAISAANALPPPGVASPGGSLVALTRDETLVDTLRSMASEHDVFTVGAEADLAAHLMAEHPGGANLDAAAVASPIERLTERLKGQFPDLILIVAGGAEDQSAVATQITTGTGYRFLHKPVSEQRVKLVVEAAWRRPRV